MSNQISEKLCRCSATMFCLRCLNTLEWGDMETSNWQFLVILVWRAFDTSWQVTGKLFKQRTLETLVSSGFQCSLFEQ